MPKRIDAHVRDYVVFDLETTGVSTKKDKIIEISALKVRNEHVVDQFSYLVNPERKIPISASKVNRITNEMVQTSPTIKEVLPKFLEFVGNSTLLGQNIQRFDFKLIERDCIQLGLPVPENDFVDTLPISRNLLPELAHHSLSDLAHYYGVSYKGAHRALTDCHITYQVYEHLKHTKRIATPGVPQCPKCGLPMVLRNSKYGEFWGCCQFPRCNGTRNLSNIS